MAEEGSARDEKARGKGGWAKKKVGGERGKSLEKDIEAGRAIS